MLCQLLTYLFTVTSSLQPMNGEPWFPPETRGEETKTE